MEHSVDDNRFDHLTRTLGTRRVLVGSLLAGTAGLLGLPASEAKKHKKKKKKRGGPPLSFCATRANDTVCNDTGRCLNGVCNPQPSCDIFTSVCLIAAPGSCCSGMCEPLMDELGNCALGAAGQQCQSSTDCLSGSCVGYRCQ